MTPPHWSTQREPAGLDNAALYLLWLGRLVARLEERWGHDDRLLRPALVAVAEHLRQYPQSLLLLAPSGRRILEDDAAAAVDEVVEEVVNT